MGPKAYIRHDSGDWLVAIGRGLLTYTHGIPSVERHDSGISFHQDARDEVVAALSAAGVLVVEHRPSQPRRDAHRWTHRVYVSDQDVRIILPDDTPGGHWRDETSECPRCTRQAVDN